MSEKPVSIPRLKKRLLNDRITLPIESELKKEIMALKSEHEIDVLEMIRIWIREGVPQIKTALTAKQA